MKYTLIRRNKSVVAKDSAEFVTWMRKKDIQPWKNNIDFMDAYAYRKSTFEKINLRSDTEEHFTEDLLKNKLLKTEENLKWRGILSFFK